MSFEQRGVFAAPLTPMRDDLSADLPKFVAHCRNLLEEGCDGLIPIGTTGEGHSFTVDERIAMVDALADSEMPKIGMLFGTSALAYPDTVRLIKHAVSIGGGDVCVRPPFYYRPEDVGLVEFFGLAIDTVGDSRLGLYIYDTEANLRIHYSLELLSQLFERFPNTLAGVKDSNSDPDLLKARCNAFPGKEIFSGTDGMALTALRAGGNGVLLSLSNIAPGTTAAVCSDWETGNADALQFRVDEIRASADGFAFIPFLRSAKARLSGDASWRNARPPVRRLDEAEERTMRDHLTALCLHRPNWPRNRRLSL